MKIENRNQGVSTDTLSELVSYVFEGKLSRHKCLRNSR
jgi:hypothetical protein